MNALLRESRAIVTEIPGTTRDPIEEVISIKDIPVKLTDTAGIRETEDKIEKIGIEKSKESFNRADLVIFILDGSKPIEAEDLSIIEKLEGRNVIVLLNKEDLGMEVSQDEISQMLPGATVIRSAVKNGQGISALEDAIERLVYGGKVKQEDSLLVTNVRHMGLLEQAAVAIKDAGRMAENGEALDFIEVDVRRCWELLGEIIGESVTEDIIDQVFARFCLGK
jgi:tRNA modification GTPase